MYTTGHILGCSFQPPKAWSVADSRHVNIRAAWDNLRLHDEIGSPMYVLWNQSESSDIYLWVL